MNEILFLETLVGIPSGVITGWIFYRFFSSKIIRRRRKDLEQKQNNSLSNIITRLSNISELYIDNLENPKQIRIKNKTYLHNQIIIEINAILKLIKKLESILIQNKDIIINSYPQEDTDILKNNISCIPLFCNYPEVFVKVTMKIQLSINKLLIKNHGENQILTSLSELQCMIDYISERCRQENAEENHMPYLAFTYKDHV